MKELLCFCAEDWRFWRVKLYIQHAGRVVFAILLAWVFFFEKSFRVPKIVPKILSRACVYYITRTILVNKVFIFCLLFTNIIY